MYEYNKYNEHFNQKQKISTGAKVGYGILVAILFIAAIGCLIGSFNNGGLFTIEGQLLSGLGGTLAGIAIYIIFGKLK